MRSGAWYHLQYNAKINELKKNQFQKNSRNTTTSFKQAFTIYRAATKPTIHGIKFNFYTEPELNYFSKQ